MTITQKTGLAAAVVAIALGAFALGRDHSPAPVTQVSSPAVAPVSAPAVPAPVQVWVNTKTGVYHMPGSRWYGNTSNGRYMSEPDALAAGYRRSERG